MPARAALCFLLFALAHLDTAHGVACRGDPIKACDCTATAITCNNKGLTSIPANLSLCTQFPPSGIMGLYFSNNDISFTQWNLQQLYQLAHSPTQ